VNRTFITDLTPARARLLRLMHRHTDIAITDDIRDAAKVGEIARSVFDEAGLESHEEREAAQFIIDTNFRAGIPASVKERARADRVVEAALKIANIPEEEIIHIDGMESRRGIFSKFSIVDFDFETLIKHRKKVLVMNLDHLDQSTSQDLVSKMFPRLVCVGSLMVQYSFAFGSQNSTTTRMGELLYPAVEMSIKSSKWKKTERRSLVAMGVYPDLIDDYASAPKKMSQGFIRPTAI
jgi:hypothetical protein